MNKLSSLVLLDNYFVQAELLTKETPGPSLVLYAAGILTTPRGPRLAFLSALPGPEPELIIAAAHRLRPTQTSPINWTEELENFVRSWCERHARGPYIIQQSFLNKLTTELTRLQAQPLIIPTNPSPTHFL